MSSVCSSRSALPHFSSEYKYPRTVITNLCACTYTHSNTRTGHWLRDSDVHLHCWATSPLADAQCATAKGNLPRNSSAQPHTRAHTQKRKVTVWLQGTTYCDGTANVYIRIFALVLFYYTCFTFVLHLVLVFYRLST